MLRCVWFVCVSAAAAAAAAGLSCDWLEHYSQRTNACLKQLDQMGVDRNADIPFPNKLYRRIDRQSVDSQLVFVQESLQHIFCLYRHGNLSRFGWDVERFLSTLYSQVSRLRPCVSTNHSENVDLSKYYHRLMNSTVRTDGGMASWLKINFIIKCHLYRLNRLVLSIRDLTTRGHYGRETPERTTGRTTPPKRTTKRRYSLDQKQ